MNSRRTFDWRFIVAFTVMLMVAFLVYSGLQSTQESVRKGKRIDSLAELVKKQQTSSIEARQTAQGQRLILLQNQSQLLHQITMLDRKQAALLNYLRTNGINVPPDFSESTPTAVPSPSRASMPQRHQKAAKPRFQAPAKPSVSKPAPAQPSPSLIPAPSQPKTCILIVVCLP